MPEEFQALIDELRSKNLHTEADALLAEVSKEWESASSTVMKRSRRLLAQAYLTRTIDAMRQGRPASVTPTGYKFELARGVADALLGQRRDALLPEPLEPIKAEDDVNELDAALRSGTWIVLGFEDGKFAATADEKIGKGGTCGEALAELGRALSEAKISKVAPPAPGEYAFHRPRHHQRKP
jgi:hypothetical protein